MPDVFKAREHSPRMERNPEGVFKPKAVESFSVFDFTAPWEYFITFVNVCYSANLPPLSLYHIRDHSLTIWAL